MSKTNNLTGRSTQLGIVREVDPLCFLTIHWSPSSSQKLLSELFVCGVAGKGEGRKNIDRSEEDARCYVEAIKH